jgi:hypothetical protein
MVPIQSLIKCVPRIKQPERSTDYSLPSIAEAQNESENYRGFGFSPYSGILKA